jgi:phosphopantothenoylcysteine decarboxylase / phosphopantothenate---cysteine ligase
LRNPLNKKKVLITCGPTWVHLDNMRVISNRSSGRLGQLLAEECLKSKARVTVLQGPVAQKLRVKGVDVKSFTYFEELEKLLKNALKEKYDVVIHAAAVSDYRPLSIGKGKLRSGKNRLRLILKPTKKLIHLIKRQCPSAFLVGFKLEADIDQKKAAERTRNLFTQARCDLVLANTSNGSAYKGFIFDREGACLAKASSRKQMAKRLIRTLRNAL